MKPCTLASESDVNSATDQTDSWRIIHQTDSTRRGLCLFERLNKRADSYKSFVRECIMHVVALYLWIENEAHMNHLLMNRTTLVTLLHVFVCCPTRITQYMNTMSLFHRTQSFYLITFKTAIIQNCKEKCISLAWDWAPLLLTHSAIQILIQLNSLF